MIRVVIIDDEPIIVEGLTKIIPWERWDCQVVAVAYNGYEGIDMIRQYEPHIILADINMPRMDGLTMLASIKSQYKDVEITILTGYRNFEYAQQALNLGVTRLLLKPSKMEELEEAMSVMAKRIQEKGLYLPAVDNTNVTKDTTKDTPTEEVTPAGSFIVKNAMEYIEGHYMDKLKLSDVADNVYVSQWHLSKLLNRHVGQNFSEILNHVRVQKAKQLLEDPALRIGDIAEQVGFLDMAHFSRVFKKQIGKSANEYRNTMLVK